VNGVSGIRRACGIIALVLTLFFAAHILLGDLYLFFPVRDSLSFLVWVGVGLAVVHVSMCFLTTRQMLADTQRPPSIRKKRHFALKWISGGFVFAFAIVHVLYSENLIPFGSSMFFSVTVMLACVLTCHVYAGIKSLVKDIGVNRRFRLPIKVVACVFAAGIVVGLIFYAAQVS
jgi:hypothetical protein